MIIHHGTVSFFPEKWKTGLTLKNQLEYFPRATE